MHPLCLYLRKFPELNFQRVFEDVNISLVRHWVCPTCGEALRDDLCGSCAKPGLLEGLCYMCDRKVHEACIAEQRLGMHTICRICFSRMFGTALFDTACEQCGEWMTSDVCWVCTRRVGARDGQCDVCERYVHITCVSSTPDGYICFRCRKTLQRLSFGSLEGDQTTMVCWCCRLGHALDVECFVCERYVHRICSVTNFLPGEVVCVRCSAHLAECAENIPI